MHSFAQKPARFPAGALAAIQPKLTVSTPGDDHEREADEVADRVMRMPDPVLQRSCACGGGCPACRS